MRPLERSRAGQHDRVERALSTGYAPRMLAAQATDPTAGTALRIAIAALAFSIIGTGLAWWSARSAARSARTARDALDLERARRHDQQAPQITITGAGHQDAAREGVWLANDGPHDYASVRFAIVEIEGSQPSPVRGLLVDGIATMEGDLGPVESGARRFLPYQRADPDSGGTVRLRIACSNQQGEWSLVREFEVRPPPFIA
jgi:hypothetical protein